MSHALKWDASLGTTFDNLLSQFWALECLKPAAMNSLNFKMVSIHGDEDNERILMMLAAAHLTMVSAVQFPSASPKGLVDAVLEDPSEQMRQHSGHGSPLHKMFPGWSLQ